MNRSAITQPQIESVDISENAAHLQFRLPEDLLYFEGHFAQHPILAGVVQIKWVVEMSQQQFNIGGAVQKLEAVKFNKVLLPGTVVTLKLYHDVQRNKVQFTYESQAGTHSSGRVVFVNHV